MKPEGKQEVGRYSESLAHTPYPFEMVVVEYSDGTARGALWNRGRDAYGKAGEASGEPDAIKAALRLQAEAINAAGMSGHTESTPARHGARYGSYPGYLGVQKSTRRRETKCHGCGLTLYSSYYECVACRGIVCPRCLACGCSWPGWNMPPDQPDALK